MYHNWKHNYMIDHCQMHRCHSTFGQKWMTEGRPQQTSQPFEVTVWISDMCLAQYVMYICSAANLLNLHPTLAIRHPYGHQTDNFESVNALSVVTEPQCVARFSSGWFAAWLCISVEQAEEQQGWVQGAQPVVITSITAIAGELETWREGCWCGVRR